MLLMYIHTKHKYNAHVLDPCYFMPLIIPLKNPPIELHRSMGLEE